MAKFIVGAEVPLPVDLVVEPRFPIFKGWLGLGLGGIVGGGGGFAGAAGAVGGRIDEALLRRSCCGA